MKRFLLITAGAYSFFLAEFFLFNLLGRWGKPELLLLMIVFLNLYLGIRYGILCALVAGLLKDAFAPDTFGTYTFLYLASAFMGIVLRRNFYQPGSRLSRLVVTFGVVTSFIFMEIILKSFSADLNGWAVIQSIYLPEMVTTMAVATYVFTKLKDASQRVNL